MAKINKVLIKKLEIMKLEFRTSEKWNCCYKVNGEILVADNEHDLVKLMSKKYHDAPSSNKEHRDRTKLMFNNWDGTQIDSTSDESFVRSLLACGWIKILGCSQKPLKTHKKGTQSDISGAICNVIVLISTSYMIGRFVVGVTLGI